MNPRLLVFLGALALTTADARPAAAQCAGDCNGDGTVAINELITGVNISLGSAPISSCTSFDGSGDGEVAINELIAAVNNSLGGCVAGPTATATTPPTLTPTPTQGTPVPTATATATMPAGLCGNGTVDLVAGETCDDGNRIDNDGCPENCRVEACEPSGTRFRVALDFATADPDLFLIGMVLYLRYPDGVVDVPGKSNDAAVLAAVTSDLFATTPRDFDYALRILLEDPTLVGYSEGTAATVEFDLCAGASQPPLSAIRCTVEDGSDPNFNAVPPEQISCTVTAAP